MLQRRSRSPRTFRSDSRTRQNLPRVEELEARTMLSASAVMPPGLDSVVARVSAFAGSGYAPGSPPYTPNEIRGAYGVNRIQFPNGQGGYVTGTGAGQTIAITDAYYDPNLAGDLATFDSVFGIPAPPRFTVLNENGGTDLSGVAYSPQSSWALEESIDVEWAHSIAPGANIVLFDAYSNANVDLDTAVQSAANPATYAQLGITPAAVVSNSWYSPEGADPNTQETQADEQYEDSTFFQPISAENTVTVLACTGDMGTQGYPATSPYVMAVGGTSLYMNAGPFGTSYSSETGWTIYPNGNNPTGFEGTGGGTSLYEQEPTFQTAYGINDTGGNRATPDVSMDASSSTPLNFLDTYDFPGSSPLYSYCYGTSVATPMWAGLLAITNQGRALEGKGALTNAQDAIYRIPESDFHDVTTGYNVVATAGPGYDEVTGIGTPIAYKVVSDLVNVTNEPVNLPGVAVSGGLSGLPANQNGGGGTAGSDSTGPAALTETANTSVAVAALPAGAAVFHTLTIKTPAFTPATVSQTAAAVRGETTAVAASAARGVENSEAFRGASDAIVPTADEAAAGLDQTGGPADLPATTVEQLVDSPAATLASQGPLASDTVFAEYSPAFAVGTGNSAVPGVADREANRAIDLAMVAGLALVLGGSWNATARVEEVRKYPALRR